MLTKCSIANILYIFLLFIQKGKLRNAPTNIELAFMTQNCSLVPCYSIPNDYAVGLYSQSFSFVYLLMRDLQWSVQSSYCYCNASVRMTPIAGVGRRLRHLFREYFSVMSQTLVLSDEPKKFWWSGSVWPSSYSLKHNIAWQVKRISSNSAEMHICTEEMSSRWWAMTAINMVCSLIYIN